MGNLEIDYSTPIVPECSQETDPGGFAKHCRLTDPQSLKTVLLLRPRISDFVKMQFQVSRYCSLRRGRKCSMLIRCAWNKYHNF